jgi:hypothetical protein
MEQTLLNLREFFIPKINEVKIDFIRDETLDLLPHFSNYLQHGYYPFYKESIPFFPLRLTTTVELLLDQDIPEFYNYSHLTIKKIKLLLQILA